MPRFVWAKVGRLTFFKISFLFILKHVECNCNINGIVSDDGCDEKTGECTCKRFVIGRDCDQCMPEHYGLSLENPNGCTPCDCDIGGSYDNNCEVTSGQCKCRPKLGGRRCDEVEDGYYTGSLDHLLFEGELALGSINPVSIFSFIFRIICQHLQFLPLVFTANCCH